MRFGILSICRTHGGELHSSAIGIRQRNRDEPEYATILGERLVTHNFGLRSTRGCALALEATHQNDNRGLGVFTVHEKRINPGPLRRETDGALLGAKERLWK